MNWGVRFRDQQDVCILVNNVFFFSKHYSLVLAKECVVVDGCRFNTSSNAYAKKFLCVCKDVK